MLVDNRMDYFAKRSVLVLFNSKIESTSSPGRRFLEMARSRNSIRFFATRVWGNRVTMWLHLPSHQVEGEEECFVTDTASSESPTQELGTSSKTAEFWGVCPRTARPKDHPHTRNRKALALGSPLASLPGKHLKIMTTTW